MVRPKPNRFYSSDNRLANLSVLDAKKEKTAVPRGSRRLSGLTVGGFPLGAGSGFSKGAGIAASDLDGRMG